MNAQVIGQATKTALMETMRAGQRPSCSAGKEKGVMTRKTLFA